jgi:glycosyltransferase involved in cell wall biosynthesis
LITGEYPPQPGGVSDYSALVAAGMTESGTEVHVWAPSDEGVIPNVNGVIVHRIAGRWSEADLARLDVALSSFAPPRRLLVQHTPNAWGHRGLNIRFCAWLVKRRNVGDDIRLMVHEPFYPWRLRDKPQRWLLAAGQRWMIRTLLSASSQVYVAIPGWERYLRTYDVRAGRPMSWLPVPSNIPVVADVNGIAEVHRHLAPEKQLILGSFGTFGEEIKKMLFEILPPLLVDKPARMGLLIGRGGESLAAELCAIHPGLSDRLIAPGHLPAPAASLHLQACDLLVQPYPDGVSSRRSSVMAGLAHGVPTVTTRGFLSEQIWTQTNCVALAETGDLEQFLHAAEKLLADAASRTRLGESGRQIYADYFALEHTVEKLRA